MPVVENHKGAALRATDVGWWILQQAQSLWLVSQCLTWSRTHIWQDPLSQCTCILYTKVIVWSHCTVRRDNGPYVTAENAPPTSHSPSSHCSPWPSKYRSVYCSDTCEEDVKLISVALCSMIFNMSLESLQAYVTTWAPGPDNLFSWPQDSKIAPNPLHTHTQHQSLQHGVVRAFPQKEASLIEDMTSSKFMLKCKKNRKSWDQGSTHAVRMVKKVPLITIYVPKTHNNKNSEQNWKFVSS